jgi:hypothetical protein
MNLLTLEELNSLTDEDILNLSEEELDFVEKSLDELDEAEINELSAATLRSYKEKASAEVKKRLSTVAPHNIEGNLDKGLKRAQGVEMANKKLKLKPVPKKVSEDIEDLDEDEINEISDESLHSYRDKSSAEVKKRLAGVPYGDSAESNLAKGLKRAQGVEMANKKLKKKVSEDVENIDEEETAAAKTIKAKPTTKPEIISYTAKHLASMGADDLTKWFDDTMAQFGSWDKGVGDVSGKNKASVNMKPSAASSKMPATDLGSPIGVKESIVAIFGEGETLSEEFKEKATFLFENAVEAKVSEEIAKYAEELTEEYSNILDEEIESIISHISEKVELYINESVEDWFLENQVAIESTLRTEIAEDFIGSMKNLFVEHYINIPEDSVDILETLAEKVEALESKLEEQYFQNEELENEIANYAAEKIFNELSEGLTAIETEKFLKLAENVEFNGNVDDLAEKLTIIKESHFRKGTPKSVMINEDTFEPGTKEKSTSSDPIVKAYAEYLSRTAPKK